jgi:ketosteroid isomerase-like protein
MSRDNLEIIRQHYEAYNRQDLQATLAPLHEDVEIDLSATVMPETVLQGHDQVGAVFREQWETSGAVEQRPKEFIELDESHVLVPLQCWGKGQATELELWMDLADVWTMRDGKGARIEVYPDKASALEALWRRRQTTPRENARIGIARRHQRSMAERLAVLFPGVARHMVAWVGRLWQSLPDRSRLRRRLAEFAVARSYAAFNRRDVHLLAVLHHPDCVIDLSHVPDWPEESIYRGRDGLQRYLSDWHDVWGEVEYLPRSMTDLGNGVLIESEMRAVGEASGIELKKTFTQVTESRNGMTWRIANYWDREEALQAVGLRNG